ncbi:hypothetical protein ACFLT9_11705 [Acidobacteriota bacterium]
MKRTLPAFLSVFFILIGLVYLTGLTGGETGGPYLQHPKEEIQAETPKDPILFIKEEDADILHLTYGWKGFYEVSYLLTFDLSKKELEKSEDEVGYVLEELESFLEGKLAPLRTEMITFLRSFTESQIGRSQFSQYFTVQDTDSLSFNIKITAPPDLYAEVKAEFDKITRQIADHQEKYFKNIEKENQRWMGKYLEERGLRYSNGKISVNYGEMVRKNSKRIREIVLRLKELNRKTNLNIFLTTLLSFIQKIDYGIPELEENGKYVLGFWPPLKVLGNNFGDCDSKSVTFASSWINISGYPILLMKIPNHMFIGLAMPTHQESGIRINGLRYTMCEVTGPDKFPPGMISNYSQMYIKSGRFTYELIR